MPKLGVLITGFGGPDSPEAVGPFMRNLTGREPAPEMVARVASRYEAIGGSSPLTRVAGELAEAVRVALGSLGIDVAAGVGMRYWAPYVVDAVDGLAEAGVSHLVWVGLTPFETRVTHGEYRAAVEEAVARHPGMRADEGPLLSTLPAYAALHGEAARVALEHVTDESAPIVFS